LYVLYTKKGDPTDVSNYRPISNLSSISKIFERVILNKLNILYPEIDSVSQHGFRSHHSTTTAALEVQHYLSKSLDSGYHTAIYSVDLSAAFDLVDVNVFDQICSKLKLNPYIHRVLVNFLRNRSAFVSVNSENSYPFKLSVVCAQGSTLGPKIFNMYVSDLIKIEDENTKVVSYADDSYVIISETTRERLLRAIEVKLVHHVSWLKSIGMHPNSTKTEIMIMKEEGFTEICESKTSHTMKVLGFHFTNTLKWDVHVDKMISKVKQILFAIKTLGRYLTSQELKKVTTSHAFSILFYGIELWFFSCSFRDKARIESVFYNLLRKMLKMGPYSHRYDLLLRSRRATPEQWYFYSMAKMMINVWTSKLPSRLYQSIRQNSYLNVRSHGRVFFYSTNRRKIGSQSVSNRLCDVALKVDFPWMFSLPRDAIRMKLKRLFFPYFNVPPANPPAPRAPSNAGRFFPPGRAVPP